MNATELFLAELEQEAKVTRSLLELVPAERCGWKPHPKSFSLGDLSAHIANMVAWVTITLDKQEYDVNPPDGPRHNEAFVNPAETLRIFDANVAAARASIAAMTEEKLQTKWTLKNAGKVLLSMPKWHCMRYFVLNHLIHHRGQLTVYLRMCDVALPRVYGPTADTGF